MIRIELDAPAPWPGAIGAVHCGSPQAKRLFRIEINRPGPILPGEVLGYGWLVDAIDETDAKLQQSAWLSSVNAKRAEDNRPLMIAGKVRDITPSR